MVLTIDQVKSLIADRIRKRRAEMALSQEAFADFAGIDRTYASQIERGIANPSLEVLYGICSSLDLDLDDLFRSPSPKGGKKR
jgi:transcriptional regulator with XRE-family HTH domain